MSVQPCVTIVAGTYWGDEGKGRVASYESQDARLVLRTTGGNNAGHTVYYGENKIPLHLIPGGIIYEQATAIICQGVVVDPRVLHKEIKMLSKYIKITPDKLLLSNCAHIIMPYHIDLDGIQEKMRGKNKIGTTNRGIGPCYEDQAKRIGIRMQDLFMDKKHLNKKLKNALKFHKHILKKNCMKAKSNLAQYIQDITPIINEALANGDKIVIEGAQASHLDILNGDYPNCTSSQCNPSGTASGAGIGPTFVKNVIGVFKPYCSRVGNGPMPTEDFGKAGKLIRKEGNEYGTTTGRPRRCGWLDLVAFNTTAGYTQLCLNHVDTIGLIGKKYGSIKVCIRYKYQGKEISYYPSDIEITGEMPIPIYKVFEGGWEITSDCKTFDQLPEKAKEFIKFIEDFLNIPIIYIGIGPKNEDTIVSK